jgi:hypothetical protein
MTLSWGPGCAVPCPFDRTRDASPLAVFAARAGASATSGGAGGATGRALCSGSIGWDVARGAVDRAERKVSAAKMCRREGRMPPEYHENQSANARAAIESREVLQSCVADTS